MTKIGVVYLCRFAEGEEPARRFLDSYRRHPAGIDHDLHIAFKGFPNREALDGLRASLGTQLVHTIELDDAGYDIGSYFAAANIVASPQLLFLNTFSENFGRRLACTFRRGARNARRRTGGCNRLVAIDPLRIRSRTVENGASADALTFPDIPELHWRKKTTVEQRVVRVKLVSGGLLPDVRAAPSNSRFASINSDATPNPHIRSNAFMIQREVFLSLRGMVFTRKMDAYRVESGRHSMTRQVMARGLRPVVVDRRGKIYDIPEWKSSSTFWIGAQENLLIADNQTGKLCKWDRTGPQNLKMLRLGKSEILGCGVIGLDRCESRIRWRGRGCFALSSQPRIFRTGERSHHVQIRFSSARRLGRLVYKFKRRCAGPRALSSSCAALPFARVGESSAPRSGLHTFDPPDLGPRGRKERRCVLRPATHCFRPTAPCKRGLALQRAVSR